MKKLPGRFNKSDCTRLQLFKNLDKSAFKITLSYDLYIGSQPKRGWVTPKNKIEEKSSNYEPKTTISIQVSMNFVFGEALYKWSERTIDL